jgi:hypothetical protein
MHMLSSAHAQTVYRCGDQYSTSAQCNKTLATPLQNLSHEGQAKAQQAQTLPVQKEADALEMRRLQAERQTSQAPMNGPVFTPDNARLPNPLLPEPVANTRGKRRLASPYFTAKAGSAPKQTKGKTAVKPARPATTP